MNNLTLSLTDVVFVKLGIITHIYVMRNLPTGRMRKTKKRLAREGCAEYDWEPEDEDVAIVVIIVIAVLRL